MTNLYIGIMSGTSLDGVDLALVDFDCSPAKIVASDFTPMPENLRQKLTALLHSGETRLQHLGEIDHQLGLLYADAVNRFLATQSLSAQQIQAIGCHGQTIWHSPNSTFPFTMQIGDMNLVAAKTDITTIGDFRRKDMAMGGQGAPLVPAFHQAILADHQHFTVVLNIGGISNISVLSPNQPLIGYDVGAGNTLMDSWIEQHQGQRYDKNGDWARSGNVNTSLLADLLDEPFFQQSAPKSTGRELFNLAWLAKKLEKHTALLPQDVQRTLLEFTAVGIANELHSFHTQSLPCRLLVCGGGAYNALLMERLHALLPSWQVSTTTEFGLHADFVEAAAFAWLAYQRMHNLPSNAPTVTGAKSAVSLGVIYPKE
ncbi:anhydro-N-acetylmuramic acid kinase [Actinobacillus porcinus]|uniref:anhydro-N-acetylmuramic acid kinase n=1 Tax=Actinobacillus porcinus TaxID=51048 RepID=UPI0023F56E46|nr:anhydro-N-acetylmuramic acid kinase [Actinobacillus porcinus]MDD7544098.1 anhydro-N-acetylmuramic acid kinase [Actinobacillus porcinus]MDY5847366.1 anhydro-N-acetylmuramic acid kinase [Actinobacillus porcinus]